MVLKLRGNGHPEPLPKLQVACSDPQPLLRSAYTFVLPLSALDGKTVHKPASFLTLKHNGDAISYRFKAVVRAATSSIEFTVKPKHCSVLKPGSVLSFHMKGYEAASFQLPLARPVRLLVKGEGAVITLMRDTGNYYLIELKQALHALQCARGRTIASVACGPVELTSRYDVEALQDDDAITVQWAARAGKPTLEKKRKEASSSSKKKKARV